MTNNWKGEKGKLEDSLRRCNKKSEGSWEGIVKEKIKKISQN